MPWGLLEDQKPPLGRPSREAIIHGDRYHNWELLSPLLQPPVSGLLNSQAILSHRPGPHSRLQQALPGRPPSSAEIILTALLEPSLPLEVKWPTDPQLPSPVEPAPTSISPDPQPWRHREASQELGKIRGPHRGPDHRVGVELAKTPLMQPPGPMG